MNGKNLMNGMNFIDERFVQEAEDGQIKESKSAKQGWRESILPMREWEEAKGFAWIRWGGVAVCLCLCILMSVGAWQAGMFRNPLQEKEVTIGNIDSIGAEKGDSMQTGGGSVMPGGATIEAEDRSDTIQKEKEQSETNSPVNDSASEMTSEAVDAAPPGADVVEQKTSFYMPCCHLSQEALYEKMSGFLPGEAPEGFSFEHAIFFDYGYNVLWTKGMEELNWHIRDYKEEDDLFLTSVADTENYDLALYPIPRYDSVPEELRQIVEDPIFRIDELTQEVVNTRAYRTNDSGDSKAYRMKFSVLCGGKVISITSKGVSPKWLYQQISSLSGTFDAPMQNEAGNNGALEVPDDRDWSTIWGGSYMDESQNWVVWLTEDTPENRTEVFRKNPSMDESSTIFRKANYSLEYLTKLMIGISRAMGDGRLTSVSSAALREDLNCIQVTMHDTSAEETEKVLAFDVDSHGEAIQIISANAAAARLELESIKLRGE